MPGKWRKFSCLNYNLLRSGAMLLYLSLLLVSIDLKDCTPLLFGSDVIFDVWAINATNGPIILTCDIPGSDAVFTPPVTGFQTELLLNKPFYCIATNKCSRIVGQYVVRKDISDMWVVNKDIYSVAEGYSYEFKLVHLPRFVGYNLVCHIWNTIGSELFMTTKVRRGYAHVSIGKLGEDKLNVTCRVIPSDHYQLLFLSFSLVKTKIVQDTISQFPAPNVIHNFTYYGICFFASMKSFHNVTYTTKNGITTCTFGNKKARFYPGHKSYDYALMKPCLVTDSRRKCRFYCRFIDKITGLDFSDKMIWRVNGEIQKETGKTLTLDNLTTSGSVTCSTNLTEMPNMMTSAMILYQSRVRFVGTVSSMSIPASGVGFMTCIAYFKDSLLDFCRLDFYFEYELINQSSIYKITADSARIKYLEIFPQHSSGGRSVSGDYRCVLSCPKFDIVFKSKPQKILYVLDQIHPVHSEINWISICVSLGVLMIAFFVVVGFICLRKCHGSSYDISRMERSTEEYAVVNFEPMSRDLSTAKNHQTVYSDLYSNVHSDSLAAYS